jgi:serpin B
MPRTSRAARGFSCMISVGWLIACAEAAPAAGTAGMSARQTQSPTAGIGMIAGSEARKPGSSGANGGTGGNGQQALVAQDIKRSDVPVDRAPAVSEADYAMFVAHLNKFGLELGQAQAKTNDFTKSNLVYSPISASLALSMTYVGARTSSAEEMKLVLGDSFAAGSFHVAANRLTRELASRSTSRTDPDGTTHKVELNIVDSIFVERTLELESDFLDVLGREYDSGVRQLDFVGAPEPARQTINTWVDEQTRHRIVDLIPMDAIDSATKLVLVNATYFYGSWAMPFRAIGTRDAAFQPLSGAAVQVPTMHAQLELDYRAGSNFAVAELPYEGGTLRMTIVLPAVGQFEAVRSQVSASWLDEATAGLEKTKLDVALPKFKMTVGTFSLREGLEALGMKVSFTDQGDFSGIAKTPPLHIARVLQKAFISVDEDGTEAAAATAVILAGSSAPAPTAPPTPFIVDRPFLFFICDQSGAVLFSGQVVDPSQ